MPLTHYSCTNCGAWHQYFATPPACFVCSDVRNALPEDGWNFLSAGQMRDREESGELKMTWKQVTDDVWMYTNSPLIGIGSSGFLVRRPEGNMAFEAAGWYTQPAIEHIRSLGGIATLSCSHPHGMGALWQLQKEFSPEVVMQKEGVRYTKAFDVHFPWDERLDLDEELSLHHVGGHYEGHNVLYYRREKALFCGDALKFDTDAQGTVHGLSCHKAFHKQIPLSHNEIRKYRDVFSTLDFTQAFTPFEHGPGVTTADALRLFDEQLSARRTSARAMPMGEAHRVSNG